MLRPAAISADAGIPIVASQQADTEPAQSRGLGHVTNRILFGSVLGLGGGLIILAGGWWFTAATCLVAYQATQEFYGFITSKVRLPFINNLQRAGWPQRRVSRCFMCMHDGDEHVHARPWCRASARAWSPRHPW